MDRHCSNGEKVFEYLKQCKKVEKIYWPRVTLIKLGDVLVFKLELISPIRRGISHMMAKAYVNDELVTEAEMKAKILKK